jgi:uncharacterized protein
MYSRFGLVLTVNHACNLRCRYCYTGAKSNRPMPEHVGRIAIDRAIASLPRGGVLELGFFGGEPLIEAELILRLLEHAQAHCDAAGMRLTASMTTNGTLTNAAAWRVMTDPRIDLAISHDGLPEVHDRHRLTVLGGGTSAAVSETIARLVSVGREFRVVMVARPDSLQQLPRGIAYLRSLGVRRVEPSLDLWTNWDEGDIAQLEKVVARCADLWRDGVPVFGIGWFDEKASFAIADQAAIEPTARCGFGAGEIAVAPSGNLYPCERLMGEDELSNSMRLPGHVLDGGRDFLHLRSAACRDDDACRVCPVSDLCNTDCRCSNYVRSGSVSRPDALLCRWNQACLNQTGRALRELAARGNGEAYERPSEPAGVPIAALENAGRAEARTL